MTNFNTALYKFGETLSVIFFIYQLFSNFVVTLNALDLKLIWS